MNLFQCQQCSQLTFFDNCRCEKCGDRLGFISDELMLSALVAQDSPRGTWTALADTQPAQSANSPQSPKAKRKRLYKLCANAEMAQCNWLVAIDSGGDLCAACELNRTIPNLADPAQAQAWRKLEAAKRRLVYSLLRFGLPMGHEPGTAGYPLRFDFLSDQQGAPVSTGHENGLITVNTAEADEARRERMKSRMHEPYRTLVGHLRHEAGHYYWEKLIQPNSQLLSGFRERFGDDRQDYSKALEHYYQNAPSSDWRRTYISAYSSAHPWEDWAESWAHYMHLVDTLEMAHACRMGVHLGVNSENPVEAHAAFDPYTERNFRTIIDVSMPITLALNSINRCMGQPDFYPFVLPELAVEKLEFIHDCIHRVDRAKA